MAENKVIILQLLLS